MNRFFSRVKIGPKLIIAFLAVGLLPVLVLSAILVLKADAALENQAKSQLHAVTQIKKKQVEDVIARIRTDAQALADSEFVQTAYAKLVEYHNHPELGPKVPIKDPYDVSTPEYKEIWEHYGAPLAKFAASYGYTELLMICKPHGHVMYTAAAGSDLGSNLGAGPYKESNLAELWKQLAETDDITIADYAPYAPNKGEHTAFVGAPIKNDAGKTMGLVAFRIPPQHLEAIAQVRSGMGETGDTYIIGKAHGVTSLRTTIPTMAAKRAELKLGFEVTTPYIENALNGETDTAVFTDTSGTTVLVDHAPVEASGLNWAVISKINEDEALAAVSELQIMVGIALIVSIGLIAVVGYFLARSIAHPVVDMTSAMRELAEGDLEAEIPAQNRGDEIGDMSGAVQVFKENAIRVKEMVAEQEEAEKRAEVEKRAAMNKLADDFESAIGGVVQQVSSASTEMQASSESMAATAAQTTQQSSAVAAASEEASANVETVASAAEELSSSIAEISRQVAQASEIAGNAVSEAETTNAKVQGLAEAANKIGEVVALITDIADQTNLLALNATIEAARAGDAGKGFAVVASEVKNLANQTAKATDEIGTQISGIQTSTQEAVTAIEAIGKTIGAIDEVAAGIASAVEEQGAATQEIARNVEQAAAGTQEVSSNIGGVNQAANDTGAAATQIQSAASELSQQSETLRIEVDKFLANVRAA